MSQQQKVLVLDIETSPLVVYTWGLRDQHISASQVKEDWNVLSWAAKWLGAPASEVMYQSLENSRNKKNDKAILKDLWKLLDEATVVLTQNGKRFDTRKLNARFIIHGMKPPSPYQQIDTWEIASRVAEFTSNSLDYLTNKLCTKYKKLKHKRFPGISLWNACLADNKEAWAEMKKYNIHDVLSTEEFYTKIRAWAPESMPRVFTVTDKSMECGTCGYMGPMREGEPRNAKGQQYKQHACLKCGAWQRGEKIAC